MMFLEIAGYEDLLMATLLTIFINAISCANYNC